MQKGSSYGYGYGYGYSYGYGYGYSYGYGYFDMDKKDEKSSKGLRGVLNRVFSRKK
jgi:hypothetical protein